jgi:hypothetical protein
VTLNIGRRDLSKVFGRMRYFVKTGHAAAEQGPFSRAEIDERGWNELVFVRDENGEEWRRLRSFRRERPAETTERTEREGSVTTGAAAPRAARSSPVRQRSSVANPPTWHERDARLEAHEASSRSLLWGLLLLGGGGACSLVSYFAALGTGTGRYLVFTGAMVAGAVNIVRALVASARA